MDIEIILNNEILFTRRLKTPIIINQSQKIKIPIIQEAQINNNILGKKLKRINYYEGDDDEIDNDKEENSSEDSFKASEEDLDEDDKLDYGTNDYISVSDENNSSRKHLRKYGNTEELLYILPNHKKPKRELTEEEIAKKTEQTRLRKLHAKKLLEEEKRVTIERILNEDGKKLRERQKKINEENMKKNKLKEEQKKNSLTKIIHKYLKNGNIYVRFPQGLLIPSILIQKPIQAKIIPKCDVIGCKNLKKYTDPKTKKNYCSVDCFKKIRSEVI